MNSRPVLELIQQFRAGHSEAGNALIRQFEPWLRVLAGAQLDSRFRAKIDPSDIVQQTLAEAVRALPKFRGNSEGEWLAWLRQILAHVLAHEVRRYAGTQKRDIAREVSLDQELSVASQRLGDLLAASGSSISSHLDGPERERWVAQILGRLPDDYRTVLILRHFEGLSHQEVAQRMGRNPGAVRMLWVRALTRLRSEIEGHPRP